MSSKEEDPKPGTSVMQVMRSTSNLDVSRSVQFAETEEDSGSQRGRSDSQYGARRQSMVGTSGFVTQILEEHVEDELLFEDESRKPIREQSLEERRASVKSIEADVQYYMKETIKSRMSVVDRVKSSSQIKLPTISSKVKLPTISSKLKLPTVSSKEIIRDIQDPSKHHDDYKPQSEWKPSEVLEAEETGVKQERSWVGTYIVGKDYWAPEEEQEPEVDKRKVKFAIDEEKKPWYDLPMQKPPLKDSAFLELKSKSLDKIESLKGELDEDYEQKRKQRMITAAYARQGPKMQEEFSEEFKQCFQDASIEDEFSHRGSHISMASADKWLEKSGILDHTELTLIHTGFCFLASGGSRHRGLSFIEFTHYLQMISNTTGMPLRDIVRILTACQRVTS